MYFSIDEGEVVGIIGVSGCGKSTLARLVSGIEKPSSGSLLYQGKTVDFKKSRKDIQLILQNPNWRLFATNENQTVSLWTLSLFLSFK